ncbi:MAG: hypothetical protein MUC85_03270 [Anaerolineales bacterium]|jgi:hypothetical protein|nr:hypothetical protein [Anaerolineales bacterium]
MKAALPFSRILFAMLLLPFLLAACDTGISDETKLLVEENQKYAVSYPANFDVEYYGTHGVAIMRGTRDNYKGARADINLLPTGSMTTQAAVLEYLSMYPRDELTTTTITLDNEEAIMIDGVPGKEVNRVVLIIHGDNLYKLNFVPSDPDDSAYDEMEALYKVIIESFDFDPEP